MTLGLDIDDTLTRHPELFLALNLDRHRIERLREMDDLFDEE